MNAIQIGVRLPNGAGPTAFCVINVDQTYEDFSGQYADPQMSVEHVELFPTNGDHQAIDDHISLLVAKACHYHKAARRSVEVNIDTSQDPAFRSEIVDVYWKEFRIKGGVGTDDRDLEHRINILSAAKSIFNRRGRAPIEFKAFPDHERVRSALIAATSKPPRESEEQSGPMDDLVMCVSLTVSLAAEQGGRMGNSTKPKVLGNYG